MGMTFQMRWLVLPLILLQLLWLPTVAGATEMIRVTGRAAIEPRGQDAAERLALEDALYMAAMAGGAELNGFSMVENGILVGETVLLRPSSRILDFNIAKKTANGTYVEVEVDAYVGPSPLVMCNRQRELRLVALASHISVSQRLPAALSAVFNQAYEDVISSVALPGNIVLERRPNQTVAQARKAGSASTFDYNALMGGGGKAVAADDHALQMSWRIVPAERKGKVALQGELLLLAGTALKPVKEIQLNQSIKLLEANPIRAIEVLSRAKTSKIIETVTSGLTPQISTLLDDFSCRPLITRLAKGSGRHLHVELGQRDGLDQASLGSLKAHRTRGQFSKSCSFPTTVPFLSRSTWIAPQQNLTDFKFALKTEQNNDDLSHTTQPTIHPDNEPLLQPWFWQNHPSTRRVCCAAV